MRPRDTYVFHTIDLKREPGEIFGRFHRDCVQRKIARAERERLTCEEGRGTELVDAFYNLFVRTRGRRRLPAHPRVWFANLVDCLGDNVTIRVASKDGRPIASILTLAFRDITIYKYGCSDERYHKLGGMQLLLWKAIQDAKLSKASEFDLGRSDLEDRGLVAFKNRWGAIRGGLTYWRYSIRPTLLAASGWQIRFAKRFFAHLPPSLLTAAGRIFYRHVG